MFAVVPILWFLPLLPADPSPDQSAIMNAVSQAQAQAKSGDLQTAIRTLQQALSTQQSGEKDATLALGFNELGGLYLTAGRLSESGRALYRAKDLFEAAYGPNSIQAQSPIANLAALYTEHGRLTDAQALLEGALEVRQRTLGATDPSSAALWASLANVHLRQGQDAEAESCAQRAIQTTSSVSAKYPAETASARNVIGVLQAKTGDLAGGIEQITAAVSAIDTGFSAAHPEAVPYLLNLSVLQIRLRQWVSAEAALDRAFRIIKTRLAGNRLHEAQALKLLSVVYGHTGRKKENKRTAKAARAVASAYHRASQAAR